MDTMGESTQAGDRPVGQRGPARNGQSGEGSRSALEHLMLLEKKRDAQLPREAGGSSEAAPAP